MAAAALLIAGSLNACGVSGPPEPHIALPPVDMHSDLGKIDGSTVLAAPNGWLPGPTMVTPVFRATAPQLVAAMQEILLAEPRTWLATSYPEQNQASVIVRSVMFNLPDVVVMQAVPFNDTASMAVVFSRSRYDVLPLMSENKARIEHLIKVLTDRFGIVGGPPAKT